MTPIIGNTGNTATDLVQIDRITRLRLTAMSANLRTLAGYSPAIRELSRIKDTDGNPIETNVQALADVLTALADEAGAINSSAENLAAQLTTMLQGDEHAGFQS